jgi:hypothetical protein
MQGYKQGQYTPVPARHVDVASKLPITSIQPLFLQDSLLILQLFRSQIKTYLNLFEFFSSLSGQLFWK